MILKFNRGRRLQEDKLRGCWFILAPERSWHCSPTTVAFLRHVNGVNSLDAIAKTLSDEFDAPFEAILNDVTELARDLIKNKVLIVRDAE